MMSHLQELDHLRIPFDVIKSATNNFAYQNFLGQGGFGPVYKGQLPSSSRSCEPGTAVAVKRLDVKGGQGAHEFLMEIIMLASYKHHNLVSLVGFSDEGNEKVLVYQHVVNGSLDNHLSSTDLSWEQRLRICLGAARGLEYLHDGVGEGHRVLHRDIKSSNILLDVNWESKISDFGLSKIGPTNQQFTFLVTNACGTFGYVDPLYIETGILTKESDVYSFGIVLFEVLCGRPAMIGTYEDERRFLSRLVKLHKEKGTLNTVIIPSLLEQMRPRSLEEFSDIAFQCLNAERKQRPRMDLVVKALESALNHQLVTRTTVSRPQFGPRTELWGSTTGGWPFLFKLQSDQKLRKIRMTCNYYAYYYNIHIRSLVFTVEDSNGLLHSSEKYGGLHANDDYDPFLSNRKNYVIKFDADEEITGISGSVMRIPGSFEFISHLVFVTNKKTHDPIGVKKNKEDHRAMGELEEVSQFSESWDLGLFDGFYGRHGSYMYGLGCCLKTIS